MNSCLVVHASVQKIIETTHHRKSVNYSTVIGRILRSYVEKQKWRINSESVALSQAVIERAAVLASGVNVYALAFVLEKKHFEHML